MARGFAAYLDNLVFQVSLSLYSTIGASARADLHRAELLKLNRRVALILK